MGLRIIGGDLKGKRLRSVSGTTTRPTSDRLRESIFNILSFRVQATTALDLFAGTGAFGIEALSRGAKHAIFIDIYKDALSVIEQNIRSCALENRARIIQWDITRNLNCISSFCSQIDLIFMDPPYNRNTIKPTLINLYNSRAIKKGACIVVEHSRLEPILPEDLQENLQENKTAFKMMDQRRYGKALISFLEY